MVSSPLGVVTFITSTSLINAENSSRCSRVSSRIDYCQLYASLSYTNVGPIADVSQIAVGTWSWGNRVLFNYDPSVDSQLQQTFEEAAAHGISLFDTADSYGTGRLNGRAEMLLGQFIRANPALASNVKIATKYASYPWRLTRGSITEAAARSADRLGQPAHLGQIHWSASRYAPWQERTLWDGLADAKEKGYCEHIGVSNFGAQSLERIATYLRDERGISLASVQVQVSLLSRIHIDPGGVTDTARRLGIGVIGYSPLCLGLLSGKYSRDQLPPGLRGLLFANLNPEQLLDTMRKIAGERDISVAQVAIAWCLSKQIVVLVGARTPAHVQDILKSSDMSLRKYEIQCLEDAARCGRQMIQNAFQTK